MRAWVAVVVAVAVVAVVPPAQAVRAAAPARPNVLLLLMDDARTGQTFVMPRALDWLGGHGRTFPNAMVSTPSCCPSRATILSGRYAHNHHVTQQGVIDRFDHTRTVQHELHTAGYRTAAVGKLFNAWDITQRPPNFDNWALTGGGYTGADFVVDGVATKAAYSTTFIGGQVNRYVDRYERDDATPWFIYAGFTAPHAPQVPEPRYANLSYPWEGNPATRETDRSDKPAYVRHFNRTQEQGAEERQGQLRTLRSVDDAIETIRRQLEARGELDNTLVILMSDNGKLWGEHGLPEKFMPYLQAERVPLLMSWPGRLARGSDPRLAANLDITPTVLAAAGLTPGYQVDGHNLLEPGDRTALLTEYWRDPANGAGIPPWASTYVPGRYRYTEIYDDAGAVTDREYYDLDRDPWQLTNLLGDAAAGNDPPTAALAAALARQRTCAGHGCP
ncbi:sulfatase-like hydrolase/transferase [Dactylosporangium sp. NPDC049525]|uniref:sulfatase-like hydrolase/transferase n=1 Tax=Dactylosporangium sp. NPDC049525 TaxID=3154730 RepID=UPI0034270CD4